LAGAAGFSLAAAINFISIAATVASPGLAFTRCSIT
jgi:hypothetical protein